MNDDTQPTAPVAPLSGPAFDPGAEPESARPLEHYRPAPQQPAYQQPAYAPVQATYGYANTMVARPTVGGVHITIAWIFAVFSFGYFLPWAIAATRQKSNTLAIGLLNFLVGWTVIGWIAAAVMACMSETCRSTTRFRLLCCTKPSPCRQLRRKPAGTRTGLGSGTGTVRSGRNTPRPKCLSRPSALLPLRNPKTCGEP